MPYKERRTVWSTVVTSAVEKGSFSSCLAASVSQVHVQDSSVVLLMTSVVKCCIWSLEIFPSWDSLLWFFSTVKITIPEGHPHLLIRALPNGYIVRDQKFPDGSKVSMTTAITGTNSFSTGEHYWEVSLVNPNTGLKRSWWLGVTSVFNIPVNADFCPTESKGYWFLSSSSENPDFFQLSTEPPTLLPVISRPERVGVYLNCERGTVIFYDVDNSSIIGRLTGDFQGEVFPFFNPGLFDRAPLSILHNNKTDPF